VKRRKTANHIRTGEWINAFDEKPWNAAAESVTVFETGGMEFDFKGLTAQNRFPVFSGTHQAVVTIPCENVS
jgi:hypothetical protein